MSMRGKEDVTASDLESMQNKRIHYKFKSEIERESG